MVIVAFFFILTALPAFIFLKERSPKKVRSLKKNYMLESFSELYRNLRDLKANKNLFIFLLSFFFYSSGISVVIAFSAIYAKFELGFSQEHLIIFVLVVNFLACIGALIFGFIQDKIGAKKTILITLISWCVLIPLIYIAKTKLIFFILGSFTGIVLGSSQSASRAIIGILTRKGRFGEDYGLWGLAGKAAAIVGSFSFGAVTYLFDSRRVAILLTFIFFLIGLLIMFKVHEKKEKL